MNDAEQQRLAHALNELRPTWPISSLRTFIARNLANRPYRDAAMALVWVALDVDAAGNYVTETPKRVLESGPWWKAAEMNGTANVRPTPPKRTETCQIPGHEGYRADACGGCHADQLAGDPIPVRKPTPGDPATGADLARVAAGFRPKHKEAS